MSTPKTKPRARRGKVREEDAWELDPLTKEVIGEKPEYRSTPGLHRGNGAYSTGGGGGYILHPDGSYELSQRDRDASARFFNEMSAINRLVNGVVDHARIRLAELEAEKFAWFQRVTKLVYREDDITLADYAHTTGCLTFRPAPVDPVPANPKETKAST